MKTLNWILVLLWVLPGWLAGQSPNAEAFGVAVRTVTLNQKTPSAVLPADGVVAMASSASGNSNAEGSSLANLVVNGVEVSDPAPNTRLNLPGVGYVVLNEQIATSGGMTVNMIHVVLQQTVLGIKRTTGEIVVGSASSSVN